MNHVKLAALGCSALVSAAALFGAVTAQSSAGVLAARLQDASGKRIGTVFFFEREGRTTVAASVWAGSGLAAGKHGLHVHTNAACADTTDASGATVKFGGAGGHFDPNATGNHDAPDTDVAKAHAGDLPNLEVAPDGSGSLTFATSKFTVAAGPLSLQGRSVVVHSAADDYASDPAGNSGARVACGVIGAL